MAQQAVEGPTQAEASARPDQQAVQPGDSPADLHPGRDTAAATAPVVPVRRRRPDVAATLSIVPGLGQLYNLQPGKALFFFLAVLLTMPPGCFLIANSRRIGFDLIDGHHVGLYFLWVVGSILIFLLLFLLGLAFWASAVIDARRSARELSEGRAGTSRWWLLKL